MSGLVETGVLPLGLEVDGVRHRPFTMRPPTVQDNIDAVNEVGGSNPVELSIAIYARQLVTLGTLGKAPTTDQLRTLHPMDYNEIERANARLEKKLLSGGSSSDGGQPSVSPSPATA